jgi:hypothetical protein
MAAPFQFDFERSWFNLDPSFSRPDVYGHSWFDASFPANLLRYDKASGRIYGSFHGINPTIDGCRLKSCLNRKASKKDAATKGRISLESMPN